jgi:multidrug efflux pump subunit AcrA (membrane-fusion protein)
MIEKFLARRLALSLIPLLLLSSAYAEEAKKKKEAKKSETVTIKTEPLKVEVKLKGFFEAVETSEISIRPEAWSGMSIKETAGHGDQVAAEDLLVDIDKRKIDIAIEDLELQIITAKLALAQTEASLETLRKSVPQDLESAKRAAEEAEENMQRYLEIDRPETIKDIEQQVEGARHGLLYQQEELDQLEKMYKADDLTEETEEIILTRARHGVKAAKHRLEKAISGQDHAMNVLLPRQTIDLREAEQAAALALERSETMLPASIKGKEIAYQKQQIDLSKMEKKLTRMKDDRKLMIVRAPHAGTVYYGQAVRGQWPDATAKGKALVVGASVQPGAVLMTVVRNENLFIRATAEEAQIADLHPGDSVTVRPASIPGEKLAGSIKSISPIPVSPGKFDVELDVELDEQANRIVAGMGCSAVIEVYRNPNAILVPKAAVAEEDAGKEYVYLVDGKDKKKQGVRLGRSVGDRIEILRGLNPGEKVLAKNPD